MKKPEIFENFVLSTSTIPHDIRIIVPKHSGGGWPANKRLFAVNGTPQRDLYKLVPVLGYGDPFRCDKEYLRSRTVVVSHDMKADYCKEILGESDFLWLNNYFSRPNHTVEQHNKNNTAGQRIYKTSETALEALNYAPNAPGSRYDFVKQDENLHYYTNKTYAQEYHCEFKEKESKVTRVGNEVKNQTVNAVKVAGQITAGRTMNALVVEKAGAYLPKQYQMLAETPIGAMVVAQVIHAVASVYAESNRGDVSDKLKRLSETMVTAATVDFVDTFDIDKLVVEFLSSSEAKAVLDSVA